MRHLLLCFTGYPMQRARLRRHLNFYAYNRASNTTRHPPSPPPDFTDFITKRGPALRDFLEETVTIARDSGLRGVRRSFQAAIATTELVREILTTQPQPPPQVLLRKLFEKLGATYIKLGQFIASSPTLFPEAYVEEFQKCLDATEPVSFEFIRRRIVEELGVSLESVFASVDPEPLASASIAQVHAAVLRSSRKEVVIKVLKPGVEDVLKTDLDFIYLSSKLLEILNPEIARVSLSAIVQDIRKTIAEEVNFKKEAEHIQHFQTYLQTANLTSVAKAPFVFTQLSTEKILTMERLKGAALIDLDAIRRITSVQPESVLISALNTWFGSLLGAETFHADVHAGNLLVLPDGKVGFIDFGIVGKISSVTWRATEAFLVSIGEEDFEKMAKALATMGATSESVDLSGLERDLSDLFRSLNKLDADLLLVADAEQASVQARLSLEDAEVNALLLKIIRTGERHGLRFPREFGLLLKQILYFDRYVKILAPTLKIMNDRRINFGEQSM